MTKAIERNLVYTCRTYVANLIMFRNFIPIWFHFLLKDKKFHIILLILFNSIYLLGILFLRVKGTRKCKSRVTLWTIGKTLYSRPQA